MLAITYSADDSNLAKRLSTDLKANGQLVSESPLSGTEHILIVLNSPSSNMDVEVQNRIAGALDNGQHIVLILAQAAKIPKLIDHLKPLDFTTGYPINTLVEQITHLSSSNAGVPLKVLTPAARMKNRNVGYWLFALALVWFILGVVLVGVFGIQAPREEYNTINTEVAATIMVIIDENLPRSTVEAENFQATVQAAPTAQRPLLVATATALAARTNK